MFSPPIRSLHNSSDIKFYHRNEPYYEFTNFSLYPIQLDGKQWPTTEHYFQAQKFIGTPYAEAIRKQPNARGAFDMSRDPNVSRWRRGDWDKVKDDIMLKCLRAKFTQHKHLTDMLLDTGERNLIEHTSNDSYWGDGGDGSGQNRLGKLLMQVRKDISKHVHKGKFTYQPSLDNESLGKKGHEKKHRRRKSISGITPSIPVTTYIDSQPALISSKQKFRSTENLHRPSYSTTAPSSHTLGRVHQQHGTKKDISSSSHTLGRVHQPCGASLITSDSHSQHKPTIKRSSSFSDLSYQRSSSTHYRDIQFSIGKYMPRANQSSVKYNIITNS